MTAKNETKNTETKKVFPGFETLRDAMGDNLTRMDGWVEWASAVQDAVIERVDTQISDAAMLQRETLKYWANLGNTWRTTVADAVKGATEAARG